MAVFSRVNREMRLQQALTTDATRVKAALRSMQVTVGNPMDGISPGHLPILDRIGSVAAALAPIRGRKAMLLFTYGMGATRGPGVGPDRNDPWLNTVDACNRAGVSVFSFIDSNIGAGPGDFYERPMFPSDDHGSVSIGGVPDDLFRALSPRRNAKGSQQYEDAHKICSLSPATTTFGVKTLPPPQWVVLESRALPVLTEREIAISREAAILSSTLTSPQSPQSAPPTQAWEGKIRLYCRRWRQQNSD
jgi:hypothetical protein